MNEPQDRVFMWTCRFQLRDPASRGQEVNYIVPEPHPIESRLRRLPSLESRPRGY